MKKWVGSERKKVRSEKKKLKELEVKRNVVSK